MSTPCCPTNSIPHKRNNIHRIGGEVGVAYVVNIAHVKRAKHIRN